MALALTTVDQFLNFGLSILTMQISKKPFFLEPKVLWTLRGIYIVSNIVQLGFYFYLKRKITSVNDQRKIRIKKDSGLFQENDVEEEVEISHCDYDLKELVKLNRSNLMQILIVSVLHFKWNVIQPLIVQSTSPLRSLFLNPLYLCYVFNKNILRPYELNMAFQKVHSAPEKKRKKEE